MLMFFIITKWLVAPYLVGCTVFLTMIFIFNTLQVKDYTTCTDQEAAGTV